MTPADGPSSDEPGSPVVGSQREERQRQYEERQRQREERAALLEEAHAFMRRKDLLKARGAWEALRRRDPLDAPPRSGIVRLLRQFGLHEQVESELADYAEALAGNPRRDLLLARVAASGRLIDQATMHYDAALRQAPEDAATWRQAGLFHLREGLVARALEALETALALDPADAQARSGLERLRRVLRLCGETSGRPSPDLRLTDLVIGRLCATAPPPQADRVPGRAMHVFPSFGPGGVQRQLLNLVRRMPHLAPRLERMVLLPLSDDASVQFYRTMFDEMGVELAASLPEEIDRGQLEGVLTPEQVELVLGLPGQLGPTIAHLVLQFRQWRPEVVHAWVDAVNVAAGIAALLAGVPRIVLAARGSAPTGRRPSADYMQAAHRALLSRREVVLTSLSVACSDEFRDWLGVPAERVATIHNGVDVDGFVAQRAPAETRRLRRELGIPEDAPVVGSAFRMSNEKRPLLWVEAAARVARERPDVHFVLLGDGVLRDAVAEAAGRHGIGARMHLPGLMQNVAVWLDMFDVVLLTSRHEGTANVLLEAQSLGRAVVAPQVGGLAETFVPGETGILLSPDPSADEVAAALLALIGDPQKRKALAPAAEALIRSRFGIDRAVTDNIRLYGWPVAGEGHAP